MQRVRLDIRLCQVSMAIIPTVDESTAMLGDLRSALGNGGTVAAALGVSAVQFNEWVRNNRRPSKGTRRAIWLLWALICRPGEVRTVFDIVTSGRYTRRGGPQHAGKTDRNGLVSNSWKAKHDLAVGITPPVTKGKGQSSPRTGTVRPLRAKRKRARRVAPTPDASAIGDGVSKGGNCQHPDCSASVGSPGVVGW